MTIMVVQEANGDIIAVAVVPDTYANAKNCHTDKRESVFDLAEYYNQNATFIEVTNQAQVCEDPEAFLRGLNTAAAEVQEDTGI